MRMDRAPVLHREDEDQPKISSVKNADTATSKK